MLKPPSPGDVQFGDLRQVTPISREWGYDRGRPLDRYYIEAFLQAYADRIRGRVLEVGDNAYTRQFGGANVTVSDVLHVKPGAAGATIIADLTDADHVPSDTFDCIVLTQTLQYVYDVPAAVYTLHRILKPGGSALVTIPGISKVDRGEWHDDWCWAFTTTSARKLFTARFDAEDVVIEAHGNVLAAVAFLHGLADHELTRAELDARDPDYQLLITVAARKASEEG